MIVNLVGGFKKVSIHLKYIGQLGNLPKIGVVKKTYLKPPPSYDSSFQFRLDS